MSVADMMVALNYAPYTLQLVSFGFLLILLQTLRYFALDFPAICSVL